MYFYQQSRRVPKTDWDNDPARIQINFPIFVVAHLCQAESPVGIQHRKLTNFLLDRLRLRLVLHKPIYLGKYEKDIGSFGWT
ncbi:MAG TPA: hypothetical protein PKX35_01560, partial [Candidatus Syntrophosphaera sp.]|nr:hypothetical protein [Candidatus Syntrophosphaera sp.]